MKSDVDETSVSAVDEATIERDQWSRDKENLISFFQSSEPLEIEEHIVVESQQLTGSLSDQMVSDNFPSTDFASLMNSENFWDVFAVMEEEVAQLLRYICLHNRLLGNHKIFAIPQSKSSNANLIATLARDQRLGVNALDTSRDNHESATEDSKFSITEKDEQKS